MSKNKQRISKKRKNQVVREEDHILNHKFSMKKIYPITEAQKIFFDEYNDQQNIVNLGSAGTGKTYISLYLGLQDVLQKNQYDKIVIVRSAVQSREQGFMPGSLSEKESYYETPYINIVNDLFDRNDAYDILKRKEMIEFVTTSFVRGLTYDNCIIILDEAQNCQYEELRTIMTRVGNDSKIVFCGDTKQDDLRNSRNMRDVSGLYKFVDVIKEIDDFSLINFTIDDIVRSGIVREFIIAEEKVLEYQ